MYKQYNLMIIYFLLQLHVLSMQIKQITLQNHVKNVGGVEKKNGRLACMMVV